MRRRIDTVVVAVLLAISGCAAAGPPKVGQPAPPFSVDLLDGRPAALGDLRGKAVLLDFWATWCPPCREGLHHLQSLAADPDLARRGLVVVAVDEGEDSGTVRGFLDRNRYTFPTTLDEGGSVARDYSVSDLPTTVVIGRDGTVRALLTGWDPQAPGTIDRAVDLSLAEHPN